MVNDVNEELAQETAEAIRSAGGEAVAFAADITDWQAASDLIRSCVDHYGGIDGLVNNAGILGKVGPMEEQDPANIQAILNVNVLGTIYPAIHAVKAMNGGGAIVNVSSGNQSGHANFASYGGSKGAVASLTYAWAAELSEKNIRVNAISPNAWTGMMDRLVEQLGENPESRDYPTAEQNASVIVYLLSELSRKLTGQVIRVDNGFVSITSHPSIVSPRVPIEFSAQALANVFDTELRDKLQPTGISVADITHLEQYY